MTQLNKNIVTGVYANMARKYGVQIIRQEDIEEALTSIKEIDTMIKMLRIMGIWNPADHLKRFAMSVGNYVCVPWTPGVGNLTELRRQLEVFAHELVHAEQWANDPAFAINYSTSRSKRANYERLAIQGEGEMKFFLTGRLPNTQREARKLVDIYYCRPADAQVSKKALDAYFKVTKQGAIGSPIVKDMIEMLGANPQF
jgi:hypothetical protein